MSGLLTYQDYLRQNINAQGSEANSAPMSEAEWNALRPQDQWTLVGNQIAIEPGDPRYEQFRGMVNPADPRHIWVQSTQHGANLRGQVRGNNLIVDPNRMMEGDGWQAIPWDNASPTLQEDGENLLNRFLVSAALMVAGGYAGGAFDGASLVTESPFVGQVSSELGAGVGAGAGTVTTPDLLPDITPTDTNFTERLLDPNGPPSLYGGDLPYGTEIPNTYAPGTDPTQYFGIGEYYYTPGLGAGLGAQETWLDRLLTTNNLQRLPGIVNSLTNSNNNNRNGPPSPPPSGGGGVTLNNIGTGGKTGSGKTAPLDLEENPYGKAKKPQPAGSLMSYLRGQNG